MNGDTWTDESLPPCFWRLSKKLKVLGKVVYETFTRKPYLEMPGPLHRTVAGYGYLCARCLEEMTSMSCSVCHDCHTVVCSSKYRCPFQQQRPKNAVLEKLSDSAAGTQQESLKLS